MIFDKDYCDYETSCILYELGFYLDMTEKVYERNLMTNRYEMIPKPLLYEANKWLTDEYHFHVSTKPYPCEDGLRWMFEIRNFTNEMVTVVKNKTGFCSSEEALAGGIKEAAMMIVESKMNNDHTSSYPSGANAQRVWRSNYDSSII